MEPSASDSVELRRDPASAGNAPSSGAAGFPCRDRAPSRPDGSGRSLPAGRSGLSELLGSWNSLAGPLPEDLIRRGLAQ